MNTPSPLSQPRMTLSFWKSSQIHPDVARVLFKLFPIRIGTGAASQRNNTIHIIQVWSHVEVHPGFQTIRTSTQDMLYNILDCFDNGQTLDAHVWCSSCLHMSNTSLCIHHSYASSLYA
jgi:hypothetical protein